MFKQMIVSLLFSATASALPLISDGHFEGRANWKDSTGRKGYYRVETAINGDTMTTRYRAPAGSYTYVLQTKNTHDGYFDVVSGGKKVGEGYCFNVQCHYSADINGVLLEETLTYWAGNLYRLGSKNIQGTAYNWEESLQKVK